MKTIAITGASGFVGQRTLWLLHKQNYNVIDLSRNEVGNLSDADCINKIPPFDVLLHLAAVSYVPASFDNPLYFYTNNVLSTLHVLEAARRYGARVVLASSYLYGTPQYLPIDEKHPVVPHNPYAQSKLICEQLCEAYWRDFGVSSLVVRAFNIYGEHQRADFLIPTIINQARKGKITLKDARPRRDFVHVNDIAALYVRAIHYEGKGCEIINAGSGESYAVKEIAEWISLYMPDFVDISYTNEIRPNEVLDTVANIEKAKQLLAWKPTITIWDGIRNLCHNEGVM